MPIFSFLFYAAGMTIVLVVALSAVNFLWAYAEGKRFAGFATAMSDRKGMKVLFALVAAIFVISCVVVLILSAAHIISI